MAPSTISTSSPVNYCSFKVTEDDNGNEYRLKTSDCGSTTCDDSSSYVEPKQTVPEDVKKDEDE
jgi:hypothetical protein